MDNALLTTIISSIVGGVIAVFVARFSKTRGERFAELLEKVTQAADITAEQLVSKLAIIDELEKRVDDMETKNQLLWRYVYALIAQLHKHGIQPEMPPEELLKTDPNLQKVLNSFQKKIRLRHRPRHKRDEE